MAVSVSNTFSSGHKRSATSLVATIAVGAVMLLLLTAGVLKSLDLVHFSSQVQGFTLLPEWAQKMSPLVPALEVGIAGAWFLGLDRARAWWAALALLTAFTMVLVAHMAFGKAPSCGCFGKLLAFQGMRNAVLFDVLRNGVCIGFLIVGRLLERISQLPQDQRSIAMSLEECP